MDHGTRPRLLIVGNFLSAHQKNRGYCEDLTARLAARGWTISTTSSEPGRIRRLRDMMSTTWRLRGSYDVAQVDVFSGPSFLWAEAVCAALRLAGKPYILTLHGGRLPEFARAWPRRMRRLLQPAAVVTTPSAYLADALRGIRDDLCVIPNGIEVSRYSFRLRDKGSPRLVWLRAFHEIYHPALALRVLAAVSGEFPDAHLTMIGPDKGDGSLERVLETARGLGMTENLEIIRGVPREKVPENLAARDIFLNTTNYDSFGISVAEAMACGLCVVSTNVGGLPYWVEHDKDALLVPPNDPEAMAAAVRRILTEPGLAARLSANARRKAEQLDWPVILPQWESLLRTAMDRSYGESRGTGSLGDHAGAEE